MSQIYSINNEQISLFSLPVGPLAANCTIVHDNTSKTAVIIDPGQEIQEIEQIINSEKLSPEILIHTHAHFDHAGSSSQLKDKFNCQLIMPEPDKELYKNLNAQGQMFGVSIENPSEVDTYMTNETIVTSSSSNLNEFLSSLTILHTPGHSPGSLCFYSEYFPTPILIAGDTLFKMSIGRTDLFGGNHEDIISSIKTKLFTLPENTIVITGHGPTTLIGLEKTSNPFF